MKTKREVGELLKTALHEAAKKRSGMTIAIRNVGGGATPTGRTDYYEVTALGMRDGKPDESLWLSRLVARALGYRYNERREAISVPGCGFSKSHELSTALAHLAGKPICVQTERGRAWVSP